MILSASGFDNYKFTRLKSDPEEKITDHIGYVYLRYDVPRRTDEERKVIYEEIFEI